MAPCIRSGDVVTLVPPPARGARRGDVVAVAPCPERLLVHRLVARTEAGFVTIGDAAAGSDGASESILGIVSRVERNGRPVWFGLGPERVWVAWAQRRGWLRPLRSTVARLAEAVGLRTVSAGRVSGVRGAA